jgi:hypothetical protein
MNNAKREEIDRAVVLQCFYTPDGIRFNSLKRRIQKASETTSLSIQRLKRENFVTNRGAWDRRKGITLGENSRIAFSVLRLAACGVVFTGQFPSDFKRVALLPPDAWYSSFFETVSGVAVEDFFVGERRDFATGILKGLDFEMTKVVAIINKLETESVLKPIDKYNIGYITSQERQRYEITDPLLKEFSRDIQRFLYYILEYWIKETWLYERPEGEELRWYRNIAGNISNGLGRTYASAIRNYFYNKQKDEKILRFLKSNLIKKVKQYSIGYLRSHRKTIAENDRGKMEVN